MPRYVSNTNIKHGQGRDADKKTWDITKGMTFDPQEMGMSEQSVARLLKSNRIKLDTGGTANAAKPVSTPVTTNPHTGRSVTGAPQSLAPVGQTPDPSSSIGVQQATAAAAAGGGPVKAVKSTT